MYKKRKMINKQLDAVITNVSLYIYNFWLVNLVASQQTQQITNISFANVLISTFKLSVIKVLI